MSVRRAYTDWAATYDSDRNLTRDLDQAVTRQALSGFQCACVLEIGCGTGKNTALLATISRRVVAMDFSLAMLMRAKARLSADNVAFVLADLTQPWPCAAGFADLIICNLVLEHVAALPFIFEEASRALTGQGRFFISELHPFRQYQGKRAAFQRAGAQVEIPAFVHHLSDYLDAADRTRFALVNLKEWWYEEDRYQPARLVSFLFEK